MQIENVGKELKDGWRLLGAPFTAKSGGYAEGADPIAVDATAVLGAGVMGGGIAQILAGKLDVPVRLKDINTESLAKGMQHAGKLFWKQVRRRWLAKCEEDESASGVFRYP